MKLWQHNFTITTVVKLLTKGLCSESELHSLPSRSSRCPRPIPDLSNSVITLPSLPLYWNNAKSYFYLQCNLDRFRAWSKGQYNPGFPWCHQSEILGNNDKIIYSTPKIHIPWPKIGNILVAKSDQKWPKVAKNDQKWNILLLSCYTYKIHQQEIGEWCEVR